MTKSGFAVVIPYFQRQAGILVHALRSIAEQDVACPVHVYVVDDDSPIPAAPEVALVNWPAHMTVQVLKQRNGGPGSARNHGLDQLKTERWVAFLDSDDRWNPYHLSSAMYAFVEGFDYYTANTLDGDNNIVHRMHFPQGLPLKPYKDIEWAQELMEPLIHFTVKGPISGSSTMVMTRDLIGNTRFHVGLRTAGEDGLFTTAIASKQPRVMISSRVDTRLGQGVSIFSSGSWGSQAALRRTLYFHRSRILMRPFVRRFPKARQSVEETIARSRRDVWSSALATLKRGQLAWIAFALTLLRDPVLLLSGGKHLALALRRRQQ